MHERKNVVSEWGMRVKTELNKRGVTQNWLISEIKAVEPNSYIDSGLMSKLLTGRPQKSKYRSIINKILGISETEERA